MRSLISCSVLLVLLLVSVLRTEAMYPEQAGVDDWFWRGVGDVAKAVYHPPSKTLKSVYTLTKDGSTVASLKTKSESGEIRWKRNFASNDPIVCISAGESVVVAGSAGGVFTYLNPKDGVPTFTAKLAKSVLADGAKVKECIVDEKGNTLNAVLQTGDSALKTVSGGTEAPLDDATVKSKTMPGPIRKIAGLSQNQVWLQLEKGSIIALPLSDISGDGLTIPHTPDHPASIQTVGSVFAVVSQDDGLLKTYTVAKDGKKFDSFVITTVKSSPGYLHGMTLEGAQVSNPESLLVHETIGDKLELSVGDHTVKLPSLARPGLRSCCHGTKILAAKTTKKGTASSFEALIKTSDGHLTYVSGDAGTVWSRPEGLAMLEAIEFSERKGGDKFGFDQYLLGASSKGRIYNYATNGLQLQWTVDWLAEYIKAGGKVDKALPAVKTMQVTEEGLLKLIVVLDENVGQFLVSLGDGSVTSATIVPSFSAILGGNIATTKKGSNVLSLDNAGQTAKSMESFFYTVDKHNGVVQGYSASADSLDVQPTWTVNLRQPFVSVASGADLGLLTAETLRSFPNRTSKLIEVKSKYSLMANVLVVARLEHDEDEEEPPMLHLTAINTLTGAIIGTMKHPDVDGEIKISVVEHYVLYHYLCVRSMRYYVGVWEMFERTDMVVTEASVTNPAQVAASAFSKQKRVNGFNNRAPIIAGQSLLFPQDVALMGPAVTLDGIARKAVIFVTKSGEVVSVPLRSLSFGFKEEAFPDPLAHPPKQVVYPSQKILSYHYQVQQPKLLVTEPTLLESTSHIVVAGQDIFYTRSSLGKPFDVLNNDFGKEPLIIGTLALAVATVVARHFSRRKNLSLQWA